MANAVQSIDASCPIKSPGDTFFNFFRYNPSEIVKIFPLGFSSITLLEGEQGQDGSIILWKYIIGGITMTAKTVVGIDEVAKTMSFNVIEGDALLLYKSFKSELSTAKDGIAKWTLYFEKTTILTPTPELYVPLIVTMTTLIDAYLLLQK